jgi:hypothetical protein
MSIPPSSVSCWLLLFLSWPASYFYAQFSFRHAPVSKGVFFASAAATFACFSSKNAADFVDVRHFYMNRCYPFAAPYHCQIRQNCLLLPSQWLRSMRSGF